MTNRNHAKITFRGSTSFAFLHNNRDLASKCLMCFVDVFFLSTVPPIILRLAEPEQRLDTCIEFTVRGYPHPKLRWFYKQKEIQQNEYIKTDMDFYQDYLEGCLTFQNPTHINNGNYTLEASNPLGTVTKTVYGHFLTPPEDMGEWITFLLYFVLIYQALKPNNRK